METEVTKRRQFFPDYSIISFFILAVALGAGTLYLVVQGVLPPSLALASALSASIAGLIMTALEDGSAGLKRMLMRMLIWRVGIGYWFFALFFLVPTFLLGSLANPIFSGDSISLANMQPAFDILPLFIVFFIVAGIGQELGWTGFLLTRLQTHFNAVASSIIRAILVGIWHLPLFLYSRHQLPELAAFPYSGWIAQKGFLVAIGVAFLMFMVPWSIFFSWVFNNTKGSLLVVAVLHGSEIWVAYWMMRAGINPNNLNNYWGYGAIMILIAVTIIIKTGSQNLSNKYTRIGHLPTSG